MDNLHVKYHGSTTCPQFKTDILMTNFISDSDDFTIAKLLKPVHAVKDTTSCNKVLTLFHDNKSLYALPVVNEKNRPVGIVVRQELTEFFSKLYSKELKGKKPISEVMDAHPIIVDSGTAIEDVSRIVLDAGIEYMVSGFVITKEKCYLGMANGYDLLREITSRKQQHLFGLAHFDQLTGLPNRTLLLDRLGQAISVFIRSPRKISLLFIDLDGFKAVNDSYGHEKGDQLLKEVAKRLLTCIREGDTAARMGGDEFIVTLLESDLNLALTVADRILLALSNPYELGKSTISSVSASIGVAEYLEHADNMEGLLNAADQAMYVAKQAGKNQYAVFTPP